MQPEMHVINTIQINGPLEAIFDLVTTPRFWPQWHPATIGVAGVTERPILLHDVVRERARIGPQVYEGDWTVVEHIRPKKVVLRGPEGRIQITYSFTAHQDGVEYPGGHTFKRELAFTPEDFKASVPDPAMLEKLMSSQSEQALQKLKALVEQILQAEAKKALSD